MTDKMNPCCKSVVIVCFGLMSLCLQAAQFIEISAAIETFGYRLEDTNSMAAARPKIVNVVCIAGQNEWSVETDFQGREKWFFDGKKVWRSPSRNPDSKRVEEWESNDGHPLGHFGVNIPCPFQRRPSLRLARWRGDMTRKSASVRCVFGRPPLSLPIS